MSHVILSAVKPTEILFSRMLTQLLFGCIKVYCGIIKLIKSCKQFSNAFGNSDCRTDNTLAYVRIKQFQEDTNFPFAELLVFSLPAG